jgi:hypothetical protein
MLLLQYLPAHRVGLVIAVRKQVDSIGTCYHITAHCHQQMLPEWQHQDLAHNDMTSLLHVHKRDMTPLLHRRNRS